MKALVECDALQRCVCNQSTPKNRFFVGFKPNAEERDDGRHMASGQAAAIGLSNTFRVLLRSAFNLGQVR